MKLAIKISSGFKKDFEKVIRRGKDKNKLVKVVNIITMKRLLEKKFKDHLLCDSRNYKNDRECHIEPDWLLIYFVDEKKQELVLVRTGSHSDLFK